MSLASVHAYPINTLKVDRSLLRDLETNADNRHITEAIIALGRSLSLTVIADGVETRRQAAFLREQACDAMQGFYVNEPAAAAEWSRRSRPRVPMMPARFHRRPQTPRSSGGRGCTR